MTFEELDLSKSYTYADYLTWNFDEMVEIIKGKIFKMSPAPNRSHQMIFGDLFARMHYFFDGKRCEVYAAPFDVRLNGLKNRENEKVTTVVQPDICVVCDLEKLDEAGCIGAPDWIIEILSPGNSRKEMREKFEVYQENGVKEYWIVQPIEKTIFSYVLKEGKFIGLQPLTGDMVVSPTIFPDLKIDLTKVFR